MKKIFVLLSFVILLFTSSISFAANTINYGDGIICLSNLDENWLWTSIVADASKTLRIDSIQFNPGAASDVCIIRNGSITGIIIFDVSCSSMDDIKNKP